MSEAKFTKGEWELSLDMGGRTLIHCDGVSICNGIDCNHQGDNVDPHNVEAEANANLIAAAPEMYATLENSLNEIYMLVDKVNEKNAGFTNYDDMYMVREIKFLLAKARGES